MNPQIIKSVINTIVNEGVKEYLEVIGINIYTIQPKGTKRLNIIFKIGHTKINESDLMRSLSKLIRSNSEIFSIYGITESSGLAHYNGTIIEFKYV